jgi:hypothetical protein
MTPSDFHIYTYFVGQSYKILKIVHSLNSVLTAEGQSVLMVLP